MMRHVLLFGLLTATGSAQAQEVPREMVGLVPALIKATVSPDLGPSNVAPRPFAACLHRRGVTANAMRATSRLEARNLG